MMDDVKFLNDDGREITISLIGFFKIEELGKEFIMYSLVSDDPNVDNGAVLLGEVVRDGVNIQILGIESDEKDMVVAYYNEISQKIGGNEDE